MKSMTLFKVALTKFKKISYWYFLVLFAIAALVSVVALRDNNIKMIALREAVYTADEQNGDVEGALQELRRHIYGHMNTNPSSGATAIKPPIQLKYRYERLVAAEKQRVAAANQGGLYNEAQRYCESQNQEFYGRNRIPCIEEYISSRGGQVAAEQAIPESLYKFDFVSPRWSPDLAGWSLVIAGVLFVLFVASLAVDRLVTSSFKKYL